MLSVTIAHITDLFLLCYFPLQDPDPPASASAPSFLLRLSNEDELFFNFTFIIRQTQTGHVFNSTVNGVSTSLPETIDTSLTGLTFAHASNVKELDNLITREFHANPNLQNNSNVQLVGDYSTNGSPSLQFEWSWKWKPPKAVEDRGGGGGETAAVSSITTREQTV